MEDSGIFEKVGELLPTSCGLNITLGNCWLLLSLNVSYETSSDFAFSSISIAFFRSHTTCCIVGRFALVGLMLNIAVSSTFHMLSSLKSLFNALSTMAWISPDSK